MDKIDVLKSICELFGEKVEDFDNIRLEEIEADCYTLHHGERGLGGIIIGDDNTFLICGSINPIDYYIEEFKNGKRDNINKEY